MSGIKQFERKIIETLQEIIDDHKKGKVNFLEAEIGAGNFSIGGKRKSLKIEYYEKKEAYFDN